MGVRFAAIQCVRMLSRVVAVLRTNIVDSGLGMKVFEIFKKEGEERNCIGASLATMCNIVVEASPLRPVSTSSIASYACLIDKGYIEIHRGRRCSSTRSVIEYRRT